MDVLVGGSRDVRATLDGDSGTACVVACPPHPEHRGSRRDTRLRAVSDALVARGVDCLRIDYGPWTGGEGEVRDATTAVRHAHDELGYDRGRVALFGYSFGGAVALLAAAGLGPEAIAAVSALSPARRPSADLDAAAAVDDLAVPVQIVYGARDTTVEWEPIVAAVRDRGGDVIELPADHFYVGQAAAAAERIAPFLTEALD